MPHGRILGCGCCPDVLTGRLLVQIPPGAGLFHLLFFLTAPQKVSIFNLVPLGGANLLRLWISQEPLTQLTGANVAFFG